MLAYLLTYLLSYFAPYFPHLSAGPGCNVPSIYFGGFIAQRSSPRNNTESLLINFDGGALQQDSNALIRPFFGTFDLGVGSWFTLTCDGLTIKVITVDTFADSDEVTNRERLELILEVIDPSTLFVVNATVYEVPFDEDVLTSTTREITLGDAYTYHRVVQTLTEAEADDEDEIDDWQVKDRSTKVSDIQKEKIYSAISKHGIKDCFTNPCKENQLIRGRPPLKFK